MTVTALTAPSPAAALSRPAAVPAPMHKAAQDFEAMMVSRMLESMFAGVGTGSLFGGGEAERTWRSFMLQEYGKAIAAAGSLGIGSLVETQLARIYGAAAEGPSP